MSAIIKGSSTWRYIIVKKFLNIIGIRFCIFLFVKFTGWKNHDQMGA
jgi:hypothetical protein